jgi:hypothetical protein
MSPNGFFPKKFFYKDRSMLLEKKPKNAAKKGRGKKNTARRKRRDPKKQTPRLTQLLDPPAFQLFFARAICLFKNQ